ncbi:MAG: PEGA domain-containing protein [Deltaproteobacteria bacterium]|nr:PEGA domain-containing protein [Deltaproteobacteria bacterium]
MQYPQPDEYHQAVQNPQNCFFDTELKVSRIETNNLGLPKVRSGNFASVYKLQSGNYAFAVRCFLKHFSDISDRYREISSHLDKINSNYFVKFEYLKTGIKVGNKQLPILKMEWANGKTFGEFISECVSCRNRDGIIALKGMFARLVQELRKHNISHCDLQHGNILINNNELKLVDYDGMYVPGLKGRSSHEVGHPNYQHPKRKPTDYNEQTDNFSAMAIYTALTALAYDMNLWKYSNGDNLLFTEKDFANCNQSALFRELAGINDADVKKLSSELAAACLKPVGQCPDFLKFVNGVALSSAKTDFKKSRSWTSNSALIVLCVVTILIIVSQLLLKESSLQPTKVTPPAPSVTTNNAPQRPSNAAPQIANNAIQQPHENRMQSNESANIGATTVPQDISHFIVPEIKTRPSGATVFIDGKPRGRTPLYNVPLDKGHSYIIRFELGNHKSDPMVIKDGQKDFPVVSLEE